jgi:hypothetical protein
MDPAGGCSAPICGCDGVDYVSACDAWVAGVSVMHEGSCTVQEPPSEPPEQPPLCGGASCGADQFCYFEDGSCGEGGPSGGQCKATDGTCTSAAIPMCGCDGATYPSLCDAIHAGVSVRHQGAC